MVKSLSDRNVKTPPHYIYDSVRTNTVRGKQVSDTIWHQIPDFTLTNQFGKPVSWKNMQGKIVVADFFHPLSYNLPAPYCQYETVTGIDQEYTKSG